MINAKSVRIDVYITDTDDNIYNIECQIKNESDDPLDLRDRYIHSILTVNNLFKGNDYNDLKYEYVIFICKFDFFKEGLPVYTFEGRQCKQDNSIIINNKTSSIILNLKYHKDKCNNVDPEILDFLDYFNGKDPHSRLTIDIDNEVKIVKSKHDVKEKFMILSMMLRDAEFRGEKRGEKRGEMKGEVKKSESIAISMLENNEPIEKVLKYTQLPESRIRQLVEQLSV